MQSFRSRTARPSKAYIALGANLPFAGMSPAQTIMAAILALHGHGARVRKASQLWRSPAWPDPAEPAYVNAAVRVSTRLAPLALLRRLRAIERRFGRQRGRRNAPRTLDLDLISYEGIALRSRVLTLPHPRAMGRAFVLLPLSQVCTGRRFPGSRKTLQALIAALPEAERRAVQMLAAPDGCAGTAQALDLPLALNSAQGYAVTLPSRFVRQ